MKEKGLLRYFQYSLKIPVLTPILAKTEAKTLKEQPKS